MVDALMGLLGGHALIQTTTGYTHGVEELGGAAVCYNVYETLDNRFISLGALEAKFWETFCHAVGHPEWIPHQLSSAEPSNSIYNEMVSLFKQHPLAFWTSLGQHADCCLQPVLNVGEAFSTSYAIIRNLVSDRTTSWGTLRHATTGAGGYRRPANEYPAIDND